MSLVGHLQELRRRVIISVIWLILGSIAGFLWYQHAVLSIPSLGEILRGPYCSLDPSKRASFTLDGECRLLATSPFEMFLLRLKVGALAGAVFASPVWLYQMWAFITPGLKRQERKWTFTFVASAVFLFVVGALLAYFVVAYGLDLLLTIGDNTQIAALSGGQYFNFILALLVIFGVSFELPLIIAMLNVVELISYQAIKEKRRFIVLGIFIFAAFMTPGQDPFSMVALAFSLSLLMELAIQFCRFNDRRRRIDRPEWLDLGDEEASPPVQTSRNPDESSTLASAPISKPAPLAEDKNYFDDII
ncbi:twin-arginine translocase subunit TatC [Corynebacterium sp. ES2794-CONJ1]|nr:MULTISPECIES: twin-arginine translocase subunit TatC [unclassified Corynebacterium]MCS4489347.1 twin-arginine translocase subunit TatC [Corynebacterium sp. ES2775-CONJ]MCS4491160.1 twin-arginine translocase subunit TatC [Corynebacterium sp. ES2715-CONJ3]MCU9518326.1 twin-arginine translocase subunit TatC [Corynebacterium sp. ES2794-CONJ1]